ncbi:MAG: tyrosine-protein phosphatase [Ruminococcus sp.]|nr:tyrosine-protein phosphatase [Ruminococcus sp.]
MNTIICKSIKNLRDLGGIGTSDGTQTKSGCFLRSGKLDRITEKDIEILKTEYHLSAVIDLRTETEHREKPDIFIPDITHYTLPVFDEAAAGITHEYDTDNGDYSRIPNLTNLYRTMVSEKYYSNLSAIFQILCERKASDGAVLFHCTEGKDRTGMISMILLSLLHVPTENILNDYLLTNAVCRKKAVRYYWLLRIIKHNRTAAEQVRDVFLAKEEYLLSAYNAILETWGSMESFAENALQINHEQLCRFIAEFTCRLP